MSLTRNKIEVAVSLVLAIACGIFVLLWLKRVQLEKELTPVVVAARALEAPHVITVADIETKYVEKAFVPKHAIIKQEKIVGQVLTRAVIQGGWFSEHDVVYKRDPDSDSAIVPNGFTGLVLPANWFLGTLPKVRPRDFVYIYAATPRTQNGQVGVTGLLLSATPVIRVEMGKNGSVESVLVAVRNEEVKAIVQAKASQALLLMTVTAAQTTIHAQ